MAKKEKNNKHFFKDFKAELKKVIWPTPKQVINNTIAVVVIVLILSAIVFILDLFFDFANTQGINRLKSNIKNKTVVETTVDNTVNSTTEEANNLTVENSNSVE
jgi:preprotein translocase subunit SecE